METALHELLVRLAARGHEIDLVTPRHAGPAEETVRPGFRVFRVGRTIRSRPAKFLLYQWWQWRVLRRLHRERPFDVALLTYGIHGSLLQPRIQRGLGIPVAIEEIHLGTGAEISQASENPAFVGPLLRRSYRAADAVIAQSRDTGMFVQETSGREDWVLLWQGTDPARFHPGRRSAEARARYGDPPHLLVTASRLSGRKNLGDMLEALRLLRMQRDDVRLVIAGDGPERAALERRAAELGLSKAVTFTGFLPDEELATLLASSDVFLSTSRYEAFGLSIVDAMSSGVPIVAYDARGPNDFLKDGEAGFVTPHDPSVFAAAVAKLLDAPADARAMGERGRKIVEERLTWERNADGHEALLSRLVKARDGRR